ncbi:MAG: NAD-dependent epimerase/dehydratase family protein [Deltaproteobacteria bacterium]|nr:NAD-dependent epimerase/dehydratase family protein [Deltaproteobacteria bacterium]
MNKKPLTYLVTGGAGFIGSHLCELLLSEGHRVSALDNLSTGRMINIQHLLANPSFHFCRDNVMSEVVLDRLASQCDVLIHLAASVGVERIISSPVETLNNNVAGTEAVLQAALRYGCRVLIASTSEVYGKGAKIPFHEDDDVLLGPTCRNRWSYAASKMVDEFLGLAYCHEYGMQVAVVRFFNTVGPRQSGQYGMVVPRFVRQALKGEAISVYGDGTQQRCFCDVSDIIRAVAVLATHPDTSNKVFNLGSQEEVTISELAERVRAITKSKSPIKYVPYDQAYAPGFEDMARRVPDTTRVNDLMGWQPKLTLDTILERVRDHIIEEGL